MNTSLTLFPPLAVPRGSRSYGVFPLTEADRESLTTHLLSLGRDSRRRRFGLAMSDEQVAHWTASVPLDGTTLGYFVWGELKAVVNLILTDTSPGRSRAELAISAHESLQGHGWGSRLVSLALEAASVNGLSGVDIYYQRDNTAMARIAMGLPGKRHSHAGEMHLEVDLSAWNQQVLEGATAAFASAAD